MNVDVKNSLVERLTPKQLDELIEMLISKDQETEKLANEIFQNLGPRDRDVINWTLQYY